jgi:hypothetical protein
MSARVRARAAAIAALVRVRAAATAAAVVVAAAALVGTALAGARPALAAGGGAAAPALWDLPEREMNARLAQWQDSFPELDARIRAILIARLGTPVRLGCLGEGAPPDTEPVFRLDEADCTVLVLTTAALAHARTVAEAESNMAFANYREVDGKRRITYEDRLHFTEDRLDASPYFRDITSSVVPESLLASVTLTLNRKKDGGELLPIHWERQITLRYLPTASATPRLLRGFPRLVGVAIVKKATFPIGLAIAHEGVLLDGESFIHASSEERRVVKVSFQEYLAKHGKFDGLIFYEFR